MDERGEFGVDGEGAEGGAGEGWGGEGDVEGAGEMLVKKYR